MEDSKPVKEIDYDVHEKREHDDVELQPASGGTLTRALKGRHMQMIAIGTPSSPTMPSQSW